MKIVQVVRSSGTIWPCKTTAYLFVAILMVFIAALHSLHFAGRNFREDEINTIHAANVLSPSETVQWLAAEGFHPPGWRLVAIAWVKQFGMAEPVARYLSTLFTLLALAMVFRLGADLFDQQIGLIAVLVLGVLPFFQFFSHELRPYSALALCVAGMQLTFLRWLRHNRFPYALLFVLFGAAGLQTHYYAAYFLAAQAVTALILVRPNIKLYLRALILFAAIALSFSPWILAVLHGALVTNQKGISYSVLSNFQGFLVLIRNLHGLPLMMLTGALIPVTQTHRYFREVSSFRSGVEWRRWYVILPPGISFLIAFIGNHFLRNLTPRNLMIMLPPLAVLTAYELRAFHYKIRLFLVSLLALIGLLVFHSYSPNIPYTQLTNFIETTYETGDHVVTNINHFGAGSTALSYYLMDHVGIPKQDMFHIAEPTIDATFAVAPDPVVNVVQADTPETRASFEAFLANADRVFSIQYVGPPLLDDTPVSQELIGILNRGYHAVRQRQFAVSLPDSREPGFYVIIEFRRNE